MARRSIARKQGTATSRRKAREDYEEQEDVTTDEEEEEEAPRRAPRRAKRGEGARSRSREVPEEDDDEEEDDTPVDSTLKSGWKGYKENNRRKGRPDEFKVDPDNEYLVHFLDDEPFASFQQHFLNSLPSGQRKSFVCLGEGTCPLCDELGDEPTTYVLFNVVDMENPEKVVVWKATSDPANAIEKHALNDRIAPINRDDIYFSVSKEKGRNGFFSYTVSPVKARDVEEDWETDVLTEDELAELEEQMFDRSFIKPDSAKVLKRVVRDVL